MAIDRISSYALPSASDLPTNVAPWRVDADRAVLLVHDMQRYFLAPFPPELRSALIMNVVRLREWCAGAGIPVAYTAQPGDMDSVERGLLKDFWGSGMRTDPADRLVVDELAPAAGDWTLTKWRYSAFFRSDLLERIRGAGREQLIIAGVYAHVGVLTSAVDAFTNDIAPFMVADAIGDFTSTYHRWALEYAAQRCAVVATTDSVLSQLAESETSRHRAAVA